MRLSKSVVAGPSAAIWTTALFAEAVRPTIVVSTKLKSGSLSHIRMVVAVKTISCLYEGKRPPSLEAASGVLTPPLISELESLLDSPIVLFEVPIVSSEDVYNGEKSADFDLLPVLCIDIRSKGDADEMHLVGRNRDRGVEKGNVADVRD